MASEHTLVEESDRSDLALLKPLLLEVRLLTPLLPGGGPERRGVRVCGDGGAEGGNKV